MKCSSHQRLQDMMGYAREAELHIQLDSLNGLWYSLTTGLGTLASASKENRTWL